MTAWPRVLLPFMIAPCVLGMGCWNVSPLPRCPEDASVVELTLGAGGGYNEDRAEAVIRTGPLGGGADTPSADVLSLGIGGEVIVECPGVTPVYANVDENNFLAPVGGYIDTIKAGGDWFDLADLDLPGSVRLIRIRDLDGRVGEGGTSGFDLDAIFVRETGIR